MPRRPASISQRVPLRDGLSLSVLEHPGSASPPLLFLHGSFGHAHLWDAVVDSLPADQHAYALDTLGHGDSGHPESTERYAFEELAQDVLEVAKWIGSKPVLAGHSVGSAIAMTATGTHRDAFAGLILMDIDPFPPERQAARLRDVGSRPARVYDSFEDAVARQSRGAPHATPKTHFQMATHGYKEDNGTFVQKFDQGFLRTLVTWDTRALLTGITVPALVLRGAESTVHSPEGYETLLAGLPDARGRIIPNATHQLQLDQPAAVAEAITWFLNEVVKERR